MSSVKRTLAILASLLPIAASAQGFSAVSNAPAGARIGAISVQLEIL